MQMLDYMEKEALRTQQALMAEYATAHGRVYQLATLLLGGGGAVGAYALGQWLKDGVQPLLWLPLLAVSLWWFVLAGVLLLGGGLSRRLGLGGTPNVLGQAYVAKGGDFGEPEAEHNQRAVVDVRLAELATQQQRIEDWLRACAARAHVLDTVYRLAACTPLPPCLVLGVLWRLGG